MIFVPLSPLGDHESVTGAVSEIIGVTAGIGQDPVKVLSTVLGDSRVLVIMDNFEHVLPAAAAITRLLSMCPNLKVLCTSRAALNVYGEHRYVISPLPISDDLHEKGFDGGAPGDAEQLFVDRARMAGRALTSVQVITRLWRRSVGSSTVCRWRSSWPRLGAA